MENPQKVETVTGIREVFGNMPAAPVPKNAHAVALGQKAYGKVKTLTPEERQRRSVHAKKITADRMAKRAASQATPVAVPEPEAGPVIPAPSSVAVAPSSPAKRVVRYISQGKPRAVAPSSRAYPSRQTR